MELEKFMNQIENKYDLKLPYDKIQEIRKLTYKKSFKRKDIISNIGDKDTEVTILLSGLIRCYFIDIEGNDITRFFALEGNIFGESDNINPFAREAIEDCELLSADGKKFMDIVMNDMSLLRLYNKILKKSLEYKIYRESSFLMLSAVERYIDFKNMYPGLETRIPQMHIASYLGITPVSLSRIRRAIKENK